MEHNIIFEAKALCAKFINKVETGRARSKETYQDCKNLLELINRYETSKSTKEIDDDILADNAGAFR